MSCRITVRVNAARYVHTWLPGLGNCSSLSDSLDSSACTVYVALSHCTCHSLCYSYCTLLTHAL